MRFKTVHEILDWTAAFHEQVADLYKAKARGHEQERVGLLLNYLADHEAALRDAIRNYEVDAADRLLETWFDKAPDITLPATPDKLGHLITSSETADIVKLAVVYHDQLIELYTTLREQAEVESIRELFDSLASMEKNEKMRMIRDAQHLEDY